MAIELMPKDIVIGVEEEVGEVEELGDQLTDILGIATGITRLL